MDLARILSRTPLSEAEAEALMGLIMDGEVSAIRSAAILSALRVRGETVPEITGFARAMRARSVKVPVPVNGALVDTCGTGGDGAHTFNISTTAAFVVAAAGTRVAKHGNRAASSRAGSADLLEALGVNLDLPPQALADAVNELNIGFLFARTHHPAMRYVAEVRGELGVRTVFNLLGPITNPAGATHQLMGVYDAHLTRTLAEVLKDLGTRGALVVNGRGEGGENLDELSVSGETRVAELRDGLVTEQTLHPEDLGLGRHPAAALTGGDAAENGQITRNILGGRGTPAQRDVVALNAGAALYTAGAAPDLPAGVRLAGEVLASAAALETLENYARFTRRVAGG
ncbi:MAG TPA: anthranilate phosphoribosyltransferase [Deinococcales bacterium]|nr:anthranilate phosphoribosyltransferase [Deinococcales bacterium]